VACQDIYFIFAHELARIFISEKTNSISLSESYGHPLRDTYMAPERVVSIENYYKFPSDFS
jgi:hypothetical protein